MAEVVYRDPGQAMPNIGDDEPWLTVEASGDGLFYGTGAAQKSSGEWVFYASLSEDDVGFERALQVAQEWAAKYGVGTIWVQMTAE